MFLISAVANHLAMLLMHATGEIFLWGERRASNFGTPLRVIALSNQNADKAYFRGNGWHNACIVASIALFSGSSSQGLLLCQSNPENQKRANRCYSSGVGLGKQYSVSMHHDLIVRHRKSVCLKWKICSPTFAASIHFSLIIAQPLAPQS